MSLSDARVRAAAATACRSIHGGCACQDFDGWDHATSLCETRLLAAEAAYADAGREIARLRKGVQDMLDGNYPHPRTYRPKPCPHGAEYWHECPSCNDEALQAILAPPVSSDPA